MFFTTYKTLCTYYNWSANCTFISLLLIQSISSLKTNFLKNVSSLTLCTRSLKVHLLSAVRFFVQEDLLMFDNFVAALDTTFSSNISCFDILGVSYGTHQLTSSMTTLPAKAKIASSVAFSWPNARSSPLLCDLIFYFESFLALSWRCAKSKTTFKEIPTWHLFWLFFY